MNDELKKTMSKNISKYLNRYNLTQTVVADDLGISTSTLND